MICDNFLKQNFRFRDLGFGKAGFDESIQQQAHAMCDYFRENLLNKPVSVKAHLNMSVLSSLWESATGEPAQIGVSFTLSSAEHNLYDVLC